MSAEEAFADIAVAFRKVDEHLGEIYRRLDVLEDILLKLHGKDKEGSA